MYLHLCGYTRQFSPQKLQSYFWLTPRPEPLADDLETPQTPLNDGFVVIAGLPQALNLLVPNYTPVLLAQEHSTMSLARAGIFTAH